jgi:hypothetical protein
LLTIPIVTMRAIMTTLKSDSTTFSGAVVKLYSAPITVTPAVTLATLTEASFTGYVASTTFSWNGPASDEVGNAYLFGPQLTFICTGSTTLNTIYGAFAVGSGVDSVNLLWVEPFANAVPIANIGDYVAYSPQISLPGPNSSPVTGP